jgi:DNA modification methylase
MSGRVEHLAEGVTLYCGDMLEILPTLGEFDACVTDPPYGIGEHGGRFRGRKGQNIRVLENLGWDNETPSDEAFRMILDLTEWQIIWGGNYFADKLPVSKGWLYWQKLMGGDFSDGELAWTNRDKALREFTKCPKNQGAEHPTQKPVDLMKWCIGLLPDSVGTIIDPYMGSGTTGVAAVQRAKAFYGIEREPKYFDIAVRRISDALARPDLFIEPPKPAMKQEAFI